jgi:hypothetical protein
MKLTDPCGFCGRTLRAGDGFHEVIVPEDDPQGREPGRYNNICGECAGFEYSPPPKPPLAKKGEHRCPLCGRLIVSKISQRLRFQESDPVPFEPGLHAMCMDCFGKYSPIVAERISRDYADKLPIVDGVAAKPTGNWLM